jgi:DnaK suppressor protein
LNEDMTLDADDLPDEMDLASSEYLHSFTFRLRGREKVFLQKIDHAPREDQRRTFGVCEQCGEPISLKRLEARLETTLCIRCKEDQSESKRRTANSPSSRLVLGCGRPADAPARWRSSSEARRSERTPTDASASHTVAVRRRRLHDPRAVARAARELRH